MEPVQEARILGIVRAGFATGLGGATAAEGATAAIERLLAQGQPALIAETEAAGGEAIETSPDVLSKMSGKDNPQMLLGAYRQPDTDLAGIDRATAPLWIVAQALRDPGNIGTILRTGDAAGAGGLILIDDCADPFSVEAVRASMGALFTHPTAGCTWDELDRFLTAATPKEKDARHIFRQTQTHPLR